MQISDQIDRSWDKAFIVSPLIIFTHFKFNSFEQNMYNYAKKKRG